MLNVDVAELKNDLTSILSEVLAGKEILILDQERPVAKLVPVTPEEDFDSELLALAAAGKAQLPEMDLPESFWEMPSPEVPLDKIVATLRSDRDEE